jgi:hypothetical protein
VKLFAYILTHDSGSNPFFGFCTLATCKPRVRSAARVGDWIVGVGSATTVEAGRLVYAMQVAEVLSFTEYDRDVRFQRKKPRLNGTPWARHGDNIYFRTADGRWQQRRNPHHGPKQFEKDVERGRHVLVARAFYYFGANAKPIPFRFREVIPSTQRHRSRFRKPLIESFLQWLQGTLRPGRHSRPFGWSGRDDGSITCCPLRHVKSGSPMMGT